MLRALPALASTQDPLREIPITGSGGDRAEAPIGIPHFAYDGSASTYARFDNASWQQHTFNFEQHFVTHIIVRNRNYEGGSLTLSIAGQSHAAGGANTDKRIDVNAIAQSVAFSDHTGGRNRLYDLRVFGHKIEPAPYVPPVIVEEPEPANVTQSVTLVEAGPAIGQAYATDWADGSIQQSTLNGIADRTSEWGALIQTDPANVNTLGTVGYFAQSAFDFWAGVTDLFNAGEPPAAMVEQFNLWRDYTTAQAGRQFSEMQPIDIWFQAQ